MKIISEALLYTLTNYMEDKPLMMFLILHSPLRLGTLATSFMWGQRKKFL